MFRKTIIWIPCIVLALVASACSGRNDITGNSGIATGAGTQRSTADDRPTGSAAISEPSEAPTGWTFVLEGTQHQNGSQSAFAAWTHVLNAVRYETVIDRYDVTNQWITYRVVNTDYAGPGTTKFQTVLTQGRYRARTRAVYATHQGNWTEYLFVGTGASMAEAAPCPGPVQTCVYFRG